MVNWCSSITCKNLNSKNNCVRYHRFPLKNKETLPLWISFTGRSIEWKPTQSSRLCSEHFLESDYMEEHKKFKLKPTAVPTIKHSINILTQESEDDPGVEIIVLGITDDMHEINVCTTADTQEHVLSNIIEMDNKI